MPPLISTEILESRVLLAADLALTFAARVLSALSATGTNRITVQLANRGDATAVGLATVQLYASTTPTLAAATLLGSAAPKLNLKVGKTTKPVISFKSPASLPSGSYYLIAAVIPGFLEDGFDNDQVTSGVVRITQPFVDLTDSVVISPPSATYTVGGKMQKPIKLTLTVHNGGSIAAKGLVGITVFGSADTILDDADPSLQSFGVKRLNLSTGKSIKFTFSWKPTRATFSGTFFGIVQVNANHGIAESDFTNNSAATATQLTVVNPAKPLARH